VTGRAAAESFDPACRRCGRLVDHLSAVRAAYPCYHAGPVPSFGVACPGLLVVGLAPGLHGANATGRPFTGDHAGILLYRVLYAFGFSSAPRSVGAGDGLKLRDCRITNAVRCLPPRNRPAGAEVRRCSGYLGAELGGLRSPGVVLALGVVAHRAVVAALGLRQRDYPFAHGMEGSLHARCTLLDSYHCSRYNTQTGRLTGEMFRRVVARARELAGPPR
jgi:uracil-DNA glycosylase family 4